MGAKNHALKSAARRRADRTGQSYEAALQDVRREYERGAFADDGQEQPETMGFAEPVGASEYRKSSYVTGYMVAWGVQELVDEDQLLALVEHAEKHGKPGATDPLVCFLCDRPVVVTREREVHLGLALRKVQRPGQREATELQMPVWTHEECGGTRIWSWSQLALERRRRRLHVDEADLPPKERRRGFTPTEDYCVFTAPDDSPPLFYLQPGDGHRHGPLGFRADRLSDGLPAVDFTQGDEPRPLPEWTIASDRTGLLHIERQGTGRWYQPPAPWTPPAAWLAAAHYHGTAIFLTAPAGSVPPEHLEVAAGDLSDLIAVGRDQLLYGGVMTISGLV
ncbi:hypothetical protein QIS99_28685 [Streptomyces sp. B-S-A8]|uniref:Uncharacterized protein n=1 Tax=Streptomyces solicavernae TaxID=3043614 RepID=A0ABT6S0B3_9ACTN|nr:hypothetical protein [Streptomyces sp. B-S-A8]MDI3390137.1 hypothetical protein [Streptomyces sp. B-S-A8]